MLNRLSQLFNIRPGEGRLVSLLVLLHLCIATTIVFTNSAAYALFFDSFASQQLPYLYIAIAVIISTLTTFYLRFTGRVPLSRLVLFNLGFLAVGCLIFRAGIAILPAATLAFVLPIWHQAVNNLGNLTLWSTAGTLLDMRQGKRLFGLVNAGAWVASAAAGFLVSPLVAWIGTPNLFILSAVTLACGIACLVIIVRQFGGKLQTSAETASDQPRTSLRDLLRVRYIALLFGMLVLWYIGYFFIDNIFYDRATQQFPDTDALAAFLGSFFGFIGILGLVVDLFVTSRVIGRFGLRGAYMIMPISVSVIAALLAITGFLAGEIAALFWLATLAKLLNYGLGSSIETSAYTLFYQPLPPDQQVRARALADGIVQPVSVGIAGVLLVIFNTMLGFDAVGLSAIFLIFAAAWLTVLILVTNEYPAMLLRALNRRRLGQTPLPVVDATALHIIENGLTNPHPAAAIYSLDLLEQVEGSLPERVIPGLLAHPAPEVRLDTLRRIEHFNLRQAAHPITQRLALEPSHQVKGAALRTLAAIGDPAALEPYLTAPETEVRQGAMVGLIRSGSIERFMTAGTHLNALIQSDDPAQRIQAARILGEAGVDHFHQSLSTLLRDADLSVRRAALMAAANARFTPILIDALALPETRPTATLALINSGASALPEIQTAFAAASPDLQARLAHIAGRIGSKNAADMLYPYLNADDIHVRNAVLRALSNIGFQANGHAAEIQGQVRAESAYATWLLGLLVDIGEDQYTALLYDALSDLLRDTRERIFHLLAFLYGAGNVYRARDTLQFGSDTRRAYALEVIDTLIAQELKGVVLPLLDDLSPTERLSRLGSAFPQNRTNRVERLAELIDSPRITDWARAASIYTAGVTRAAQCKRGVDAAAESPVPIVRETALWARAKLALVTASAEDSWKLTQPTEWSFRSREGALIKRMAMFSTIEKVIILKTIPMFSETPDEALTEIAMLLEEQDAIPGQNIVAKGDPGSSMYIITSGKVRVHDGEHTFNFLGDNEVFGELALLDSEPRSASVTAVESTHLFKLEQEPFYELMHDRSEVARGIIRMLVGSVRARVQELKATR